MSSPQQLDNSNIKILPHTPLSQYTTFKLGGPARGLINCQTPDQLQQAVRFCLNKKADFILIGGGSNIVVSDVGLNCYVLRYVSDVPLIRREGHNVIVSGSTSLDALALFAAQEGLEGINYCSGIPGTVGGAVVGNAGAFGKQIGDVLISAVLLKRDTGEKFKVQKDYCRFTYRHSALKETNDIVLEIEMTLTPADSSALLAERESFLNTRREKHPNLSTHPCAGSFFRNIEPTSKAEKRQAAGWFLEEAGAKSLSVGGAKIFDKHANIIVKSVNCTSQDVFELSQKMIQSVKDKFGFTLTREVRFVGPFKNMPAGHHGVIW